MKKDPLISIIGAGPGDPELLTLKAHKRLINAEIVLYDGLLGEEILKLVPPETEQIYVGKKAGDCQNQTNRQVIINNLMKKYYHKNKRVVRLKTGDPLVFGRGIEEIRFLRNENIEYEVIPGITAGIAAANLMQIPITERSLNSSVLFCTGSTVNEDFSRLEAIANMMKEGTPLVIYMGLLNLHEVIKKLMNHGVKETTRVCIVSKVSQKSENLIEADFKTICNEIERQKPETPAVILMGEYTHSMKSQFKQ